MRGLAASADEPRRGVKAFIFAAALTTGLVGCSSPAEQAPAPAGPTSTSTGPAQVGRFASENPGSVNTFWLGPLHEAYPQAPIYASESTVNLMRTDSLMFYPLARSADADFPAQLTYPSQGFGPGASLELGGIRMETAEFGPGESQTATSYYEPSTGALFSGDLTSNQATPFLLEGDTCGWLTNLDQLRNRFPNARTIYPGHGAPADAGEQIQAQRSYLQTFRGLVRPAVSSSSSEGQSVSVDERTSITAEVERRYPGYPRVSSLPTLQEVNVAGLASELIAENPANLPAVCRI